MYDRDKIKVINNNYGINFFGLLTVAFIVLKLTGEITWSWWWVLSPLWGGFLFLFVVFLGLFTYHATRK